MLHVLGVAGCRPFSPAHVHDICFILPTARHLIYPTLVTKSSHGAHSTHCNLATSESHSTPGIFTRDVRGPHFKGLPLQVTVREARFGDIWEVADTHCGAFLPDLVFPMDVIMRLDRVVAMVGGLAPPTGCQRKCLVAVGCELHDGIHLGGLSTYMLSEEASRSGSQLGSVLGVITVDTLAEFLPRRKSTGSRRTGIAYVSNVAVQQWARRKGVARRLVQQAEVVASQWGCRSIALHCDKSNPGALALYSGAGFKAVKVPYGARWPQPKAVPGTEFCLMMKCLG